MKKILIITNQLVVGGIEKALWEMLKKNVDKDVEITIAVCQQGGELYEKFSERYNVQHIPQINNPIKQIILEKIKQRHACKAISITWNVILCNVLKDYNAKCFYRSKIYDTFPGQFDVAICYHKPTDLPVTYVLNCVNAKYKWLWLHSELRNISEHELRWYKKIYSIYDRVICASKSISDQFVEKFPEFEEKVSVFRNVIDVEEIEEKAKQGEKLEYNGKIQILTVARLSQEKGIDLALRAAAQLKKQGVGFLWTFIGDGEYRQTLLDVVSKLNISDVVEFKGVKENP